MMYVKLDITNNQQISFLKQELRPFYNKEILNWQYYRWKKSNACLYLLNENGKYIASQGMIPIHLTFLNKSRITAKSETSFLLPQYRGKSVFEELYFYTIEKAEEDNVELIWGFTALSKVWRNKLKFKDYEGLISETELQLSFCLAMRFVFTQGTSITKKIKQTIKTFINAVKRSRLPRILKEFTIKEVDCEDRKSMEVILGIYDNWKHNHSSFISIDLTFDYLQWRIKRNPLLNYKLVELHNKNQIFGFAIINITKSYAYLDEFIVLDNKMIRDGLLLLLKYCKEVNRCSYINYWASNQNGYSKEVQNILCSIGARKMVNNNMNFVYKKTKHNSFAISDASSFYINGLWTEGFNI